MDVIDRHGAPPPGTWRTAADGSEVADALAGAVAVRAVEVVGAVPSTQDVARERARLGAPSGTLVVAERQTAGRGRVGRSWDDDARPGASLAATLLLGPELAAAERAGLVPLALGLAVLEAVAPWLGTRPGLKWPNDVVVRVGGAVRKVAGLLVERDDAAVAAGPVLLAGIGLNIDRRHLPSEADRAGVADLADADVAPAALLGGLVRGLDVALGLLAADPADLLVRYRDRSDTCGRDVRVLLPDGTELVGRADVDDAGRLTLRSALGSRTVLAGTVRDAGDGADGP